MLNHILKRLLRLTCFQAVVGAFILALLEAQLTFATTAVVFGNAIEFMPSGLTNYDPINAIRESGFNTMAIFTMSVDTNGNFVQSGKVICSNGVYTGDPTWGGLLAQCKPRPQVSIGFTVGQ